MLQDRNGNIWISSQGGGISRYGGNAFTQYSTAQGLAANLIFSGGQDKAGNLWFGTYEGGVSRYDGHAFASYSRKEGLPDVSVWSILPDRDGTVWFGTDRAGAIKFDGIHFITYTTKQGLASNAVISMMQDKQGNVWMGTREGGVSMFDGKRFTNYTTVQGLAGNAVWSIAQDKQGNIWFGTHDGGASKFDGHHFVNYSTLQGLAGNSITAVLADNTGTVWLGTDSRGVSRYDGRQFRNYTTANGLSDNAISFIVEDRSRNMVWMGTNKGLSGVKENLAQDSITQRFENFSQKTGYPITDLSTGGIIADNKGIIWAGSGAGKLIRFDYEAIHPRKNLTPIHLVIQNVGINNDRICWNCLLQVQQPAAKTDSNSIAIEMLTSFGSEFPFSANSQNKKYGQIRLDSIAKFYPIPQNLVLPHEYNSLSIDFAAIEPAFPEQVQYQYKMEGYNNDWTSLSNSTKAVFGNMPGGRYTFRVKARNALGATNEISWSFRVLPPIWLSWKALLLYIVIVFSLLYTAYSLRVGVLKRKQAALLGMMLVTQNEERKRISQDLHDVLGARLTHINLLSALGQQKINTPQEISAHLKKVSGEVQVSADALDDIVWSIDTNNDDMPSIIARMRRFLAGVLDATSTVYTMDIDEQSLPTSMTAAARRDLFLVFTEAINNVQKHAEATQVNVSFRAENNELVLEVMDNGKGFEKGLPSHRNGLKNMLDRMQKWGGTIYIDSKLEQGTFIKIILPVKTASFKKGIRDWFKKS